jgi:hypothetical protein
MSESTTVDRYLLQRDRAGCDEYIVMLWRPSRRNEK